MRHIMKFGFASVLIILIGFSLFTPVLAADEWTVEEGDELVFDLTGWEEDDIVCEGSLTLTIEEIDSSGELRYSIGTDFEIDENNYDNDIEVDDETTNNQVWTPILTLLYSVDSFEDFVDNLAGSIADMEDFYDMVYGDNDSIIFSIEELEYGFEMSMEDTEQEFTQYVKSQYDEDGILKYGESTWTEDEEKGGFVIEKKGFTIPSFPMEIFIAIFAISTLGIIIRSKKHK